MYAVVCCSVRMNTHVLWAKLHLQGSTCTCKSPYYVPTGASYVELEVTYHMQGSSPSRAWNSYLYGVVIFKSSSWISNFNLGTYMYNNTQMTGNPVLLRPLTTVVVEMSTFLGCPQLSYCCTWHPKYNNDCLLHSWTLVRMSRSLVPLWRVLSSAPNLCQHCGSRWIYSYQVTVSFTSEVALVKSYS